MANFREARVYVGTYRKYNEGSIEGEWLDLADYSDKHEFYEACRQLHADEDDPEFMFQDWEEIPEGMIGECWINDNIFELIQSDDLSDDETEAFMAWASWTGEDLASMDVSNAIERFRDQYCGEYDSEKAFAMEIASDEIDNNDSWIARYFDYDAFARDLFICDYTYWDGYVFNMAA